MNAGIEQHAGHQREHPDDDRLSHGAIRQSLIIISAICFQIGAASRAPNPAGVPFHWGSLRMTIIVNSGFCAGMKPTKDATTLGP